MFPEQTAHPAKDQLLAFGQGKLAADESSSVEQHLEFCRECCETLLDLKDDTFVGLVKIAQSSGDRRMDAFVRPADASSNTESNKDRTGRSAHPTDAATVLVQSGEPVGPDELPVELADHPRYRIVELIGRGGMGNVYRAEHRLMNRAVAIKLINSQLIRQPQAVERFRREVQAAAKLTHPNIVTAYDAEQAGDVHYLVMEFVEGTDLASVVKHRGPMSVAEACECIRQVAEGLQHAHESGMVHRDIKPHNLMLSAKGQVRILDFGLAGFASEAAFEGSTECNPKRERGAGNQDEFKTEASGSTALAHASGYIATAAHLTTVGSVMGTPDYMAPEQAVDAHSAGIRADIYSLGCTLHFLLTGKPPFEAENVLAKLKSHANEPPPSLMTLRNDVPAELSKVVQRMMAKNPAERFQTPAAVAEALAPFAAAASPPRRRIGRAIAAAFLLAAMIFSAVVIYVQTDTGEFEIHATDEVAVQIENSRVKIRDKITGRDYQLTAGKHSIRKGEYVINVTELPDGLTVDTDKFSLTRGGKAKVTVSFKPKESPAAKTDRGVSPPVSRSDFAEVGRFMRHEGSASHAIFSPSGRYGISCGADKTIRVWDIATQEEKRVLKGHEGSVFGLAISTDGKLLASCDNAKSIRLWNLETGEQVGELTGHTEAITDLAFMPDRTHLLSAGFDSTLRLWHVADRKLVRTIDIGTVVEKMVPLPDGRRVMLSGAHTRGWGPRIYDLEKGEKIDATLNGYSCMAVSTDGRMSLIGSLTGVLVVRDTVNDKVIVQMTDPRAATARDRAARDAAITPDGRFAITTTREKQMHLWDLHQGKLLSIAELDSVSTISLSPDGRFALTIGQGKISVWRLPESVLEPIAPGSSDNARMQGKPAALTPPPVLKVGVNLVTDPSLEETAIGQKYPLGWGTGNVNPPNSFKHHVVEGGRTGQRGWLIEGNGQFAVIPTNRPPAHSAYRYAATAWVRIESGSAQIKLLYFDGQGQYIGENRGNVSIQQDGWHKLTMVDDLKSYPEARSLSLALTMTGAGKAVFDDLELLAFDASKLPEKFEATYGAASHSADVFDRWVGRWESTTTYAPTAATPEERVIKGETIVRKVLSDRFLLWQWSSDDGQSQYLTLLCFNDNTQAYQIWLFGSGGEVFDRTGQWNAASQTLTLQVKPSSPGVTGMSTDRFVSQDRIESTLLVKGSGGQVTRDMRATWIRKSKTVEGEIDLADGPRADVSELAVLQKMVGRWSVRQTIKPCIAFPQGDQATGTEHNAWVLGGRFFLNRAYDDQQRLTSLALQTYDPVEKTYQHWHFAKDVFGGQWRITWDASSRAFHWRSIDMPAGWIGTGFNRWINDDTFDNQALIKDENGRTIFDSHQDKRRKK